MKEGIERGRPRVIEKVGRGSISLNLFHNWDIVCPNLDDDSVCTTCAIIFDCRVKLYVL